jgi:translation initiation factor 2A
MYIPPRLTHPLSGPDRVPTSSLDPIQQGAPASFKIYPLQSLSGSPSPPPPPTCQKTFYKADRCSVKWNGLGTQVSG